MGGYAKTVLLDLVDMVLTRILECLNLKHLESMSSKQKVRAGVLWKLRDVGVSGNCERAG